MSINSKHHHLSYLITPFIEFLNSTSVFYFLLTLIFFLSKVFNFFLILFSFFQQSFISFLFRFSFFQLHLIFHVLCFNLLFHLQTSLATRPFVSTVFSSLHFLLNLFTVSLMSSSLNKSSHVPVLLIISNSSKQDLVILTSLQNSSSCFLYPHVSRHLPPGTTESATSATSPTPLAITWITIPPECIHHHPNVLTSFPLIWQHRS